MLTTTSNPIQILFFEDNPADANFVTECLSLAAIHYNIRRVKHLDDGLEELRSGKFDVILLDQPLEEGESMAKLKAIQASAKDSAIIILTNSENEGLSSVALQAGAQDYLVKGSLKPELLYRSIRYAMERRMHNCERERHLHAIEHQESLLHSIFEANTDAMLILDRKYEIKFVNPAATRLLGSEEISLIGETFPFEVSTTQSPELEIPEANGGSRIVELSANDLLWEDESALLVMLRDITQRRTFEIALNREKERLAVTLDSIADAVIATDSSGVVERMNQEASRLTGVSNQEATGRPLAQVLRLKDPASGEFITNPSKECIEGLGNVGLPLVREDKTLFLVTAEMRYILDKAGNHHGCVTVLRDITWQKKMEDENFKQEKLNSISLLAGGIAHDFNNMLTAILGNLSVARMNMAEDDKNSKKILAAETAALQARSLTQQLLTFSKGGVPSFEITTIDQVVEESAQFVLRGSNVKCEVEKEEGLWAVDADKGQISQVVNNLIINADQAMPAVGTITVKLGNCILRHAEVPALKAGEYVCIEVADQGIGIRPENMKRVFDPYFTTKDDGNGLGLASGYSIVRSHHGAIRVESEVDRGTSFYVYLPKTTKHHDTLPTNQEPAKKEPETIHKGSGRILVMDDMEAMMLVAGEILNVLGYEVAFATNGEEAIEAYKKAKESGDPFDAVVFDLTVPGGMGGEEASNILIEYDPELIAIASSGYSTSNIMSNYKDSAFKAAVPKPYRIKEMSDALHQVLHQEE
jgi:PAS domain S-box-containing protein